MNFKVSMQTTLAAFRQAFSEYFPNLSLSFFSKPQEVFQASPVKYMITDLNQTLQQIQKQALSNEVAINDDTTAEELEAVLEQNFGLHVQVMWKDDDGWDHTSTTDHLTLCEQNELAGKIHHNPAPKRFNSDYADARTEWYLG